jgi:hypothetical protein
MSPPLDVLVVSGEPLWPPVHGGRLRTAGIVEELARHLTVRVLAPLEAPPPAGVTLDVLTDDVPAPATFGLGPRLAAQLLGPVRRAAVGAAVAEHRPRTVLVAPAYLAAGLLRLGVPVALDFHDVEVRRMASLRRVGPPRARLVHALEAVKARRWEPALARGADVVTAVSQDDVDLLSSWGATALLVPHGSAAARCGPSPALGPVTFVAGFGYLPNLDAARFLVDEVWPQLHAAEPGLRLRLVGRAADRVRGVPSGVEVVSDPPGVDRFYEEASLVLAPVRAGGGAQVKVAEAQARGRVLVAGRGPGFADEVLRLWRDLHARRAREAALTAPTWAQACAPLVEHLARAAVSR